MSTLFPAFPWTHFALGALWCLLALAALLTLTFAIGVHQKRHVVIDAAWGLGFVVVAWTGFAASQGYGYMPRKVALVAVTTVWGVRLAGFLVGRMRGAGEDPRYTHILDDAPGNRNVNAIKKAYLPQAAVLFVVSMVQQVGMYSAGGWAWLVWVGVVVALVGVAFEGVGDWQMARFRADPSLKGTIMDKGLWGITRHPNYFGDATAWWGMFLVTASAWPGVLTVISPVLMNLALVKRTGVALTERRMMGRPGFAEYVERTPAFVPWIGKKGPVGK